MRQNGPRLKRLFVGSMLQVTRPPFFSIRCRDGGEVNGVLGRAVLVVIWGYLADGSGSSSGRCFAKPPDSGGRRVTGSYPMGRRAVATPHRHDIFYTHQSRLVPATDTSIKEVFNGFCSHLIESKSQSEKKDLLDLLI